MHGDARSYLAACIGPAFLRDCPRDLRLPRIPSAARLSLAVPGCHCLSRFRKLHSPFVFPALRSLHLLSRVCYSPHTLSAAAYITVFNYIPLARICLLYRGPYTTRSGSELQLSTSESFPPSTVSTRPHIHPRDADPYSSKSAQRPAYRLPPR
jgi:hypothetical protein